MEKTATDKPVVREKGKPDEIAEGLSFCTKAPSAEQARKSDDDEPCDDSRAGAAVRDEMEKERRNDP
jgi:hypothetical protein